MWILVIMTLLNACLPNDILIEKLRYNIAGVPINSLDWCLVIGTLAALSLPNNGRLETARLHPVLLPTLALFFAAIVLSSIRSMSGTFFIELGYYMRTVRHYAAFPAAMALGYFLLHTPRAALRFVYVLIISGLVTALMIIFFFKGKGEEFSEMEIVGVNGLRTIAYATPFASLAFVILIYSVLADIRLLPRFLTYLVGGISIVGVFVTLTRSEWLSAFFALLSIVFIVPRDKRMRLIGRMLFSGTVLTLFLALSIAATSAITKSDFSQKISERVLSMLPWTTDSVGMKAWDTRTPGMMLELQMFRGSPIIGQGFGSQYAMMLIDNSATMRHNAFTSILAETGLIGITPVLISLWAMGLLGLRIVRARTDTGTLLIGAIGFISANLFFVLGMSTMSFNNERLAVVVGMLCGMVLRARAMQLTMTRLQAQEQLEHHEEWDSSWPAEAVSENFTGGF